MSRTPSLRQIEPGTYRLFVPWVKPPTKNQWERMHWAARRRIKNRGFEWIVEACLKSETSRFQTPVTIQPVVLLARTHNRPDAASYQAAINEVLIDRLCEDRVIVTKKGAIRHKKGVGLIPDDGPDYVTELSTIVEFGSPVEGVQLIITEPKESHDHGSKTETQ